MCCPRLASRHHHWLRWPRQRPLLQDAQSNLYVGFQRHFSFPWAFAICLPGLLHKGLRGERRPSNPSFQVKIINVHGIAETKMHHNSKLFSSLLFTLLESSFPIKRKQTKGRRERPMKMGKKKRKRRSWLWSHTSLPTVDHIPTTNPNGKQWKHSGGELQLSRATILLFFFRYTWSTCC